MLSSPNFQLNMFWDFIDFCPPKNTTTSESKTNPQKRKEILCFSLSFWKLLKSKKNSLVNFLIYPKAKMEKAQKAKRFINANMFAARVETFAFSIKSKQHDFYSNTATFSQPFSEEIRKHMLQIRNNKCFIASVDLFHGITVDGDHIFVALELRKRCWTFFGGFYFAAASGWNYFWWKMLGMKKTNLDSYSRFLKIKR